jgi:D-3-phosphoglycerate dehydrogenase
VDNIDLEAAARRGIPVTIALGANAQSVAEHALALMLSVARSTPWLDQRMRQGHWDKASHTGIELSGKSLGIVGAGSIGRILIGLVAPFRMTVRVYDPYMPTGLDLPGAERVDTLDALLEASDIISLHCPATPQTSRMIGAPQFERMRPGTILINTARGELIDTDALVAALAAGRIAGVGLDTFSPEPPPADSPLFRLPNLVVTPHVGANTHEAKDRVGVLVMRQVLDCLDGLPPDPRAIVNRHLLAPA